MSLSCHEDVVECRHSSPRHGYNNVVVHSTELVVDLISRRLILELDENVREVRTTIARNSTGGMNKNRQHWFGILVESVTVL
jgi:hypothetical protein